MARCVAVKKDSSFKDLEGEVERVFGVKRKETSIDLSFWCAGEDKKGDQMWEMWRSWAQPENMLHPYLKLLVEIFC
ncbi:predicted protein [Arabidopsis lyrata subsp. lyrata]|uniref:Predicted protein n=1 Tax=Arabidopsis lyrata subsp. lyrata TaxID=81972 RepID=D7KTS6_ARALL|nr:predicted protein [Arabidopsis lyrata subsp. lyrata]